MLPTERKGLHPSLVASRLETEVTCDFCPFGDSYPWHQPQSKEIQATQVLQQPPTGLTGEEDAALAATWLQVQVRTQRRERAGGCGCCSSLGRQLCWGSSASGSSRFFGLPAPGVLSPFADSERAGPAEPAGAQYLAWVAGPGDAWELRGLWAGLKHKAGLINAYCFKPLKFRIICYTPIDKWASRVVQWCLLMRET